MLQYTFSCYQSCTLIFVFVTPALEGRLRHASFHLPVCSSIHQHLPWVSCERNSSYNFVAINLKLSMFLPWLSVCLFICLSGRHAIVATLLLDVQDIFMKLHRNVKHHQEICTIQEMYLLSIYFWSYSPLKFDSGNVVQTTRTITYIFGVIPL